jgi:GDPmannose 4,6-dehydratase
LREVEYNEEFVEDILRTFRPDYVFNLAGEASSAKLHDYGAENFDINGHVVTRWLHGIMHFAPRARLFHPLSSEIFGSPSETPQNELTALNPQNPYAITKCYTLWMARYFRKRYEVFVSTGITYNHESPRRDEHYLARKVSRGVARISLGMADTLSLGDLNARRDWSDARDFVKAMYLILSHNRAEDFILASGESHSVRELCEVAFSHVGLDYRDHVISDRRFTREKESGVRVGNPNKLMSLTGWQPKSDFESLVREMVDYDLRDLKKAG